MLAEKTLNKQTIDMRLADKADKLEQLLLSDEEIATLEKLAMPGAFDSPTTQRWFANCGGCRGCRGCRGCGGCSCRGCHGCRGCRGCWISDFGTVPSVIEDNNEFGFGH